MGGIETPGALEVARIPGVIVPSVIVPVCVVPVWVVSTCVYTSVAKCVLRCTHSGSARACVRATPCVSGVFASVPECVLPSTPCVKGAPQAEEAACANSRVGVRHGV